MKAKSVAIISVLFFFGLITSCATTDPTMGLATTLEEAHPDRFEKTKIGMSVDEFKSVWPEAARSGISNNSETYEFVYTHLAPTLFVKTAYDYKIFTNFYFTNNILVRYESSRRTL